ncbi:MAG: cytochrome c biogenesis CcdA family protein, partial [Anaerolineales bacterium]
MQEFPLAFAFTAGLFAPLNPCGWAMLPSFVSYYLGTREEGGRDVPYVTRALEGLSLGSRLTVGFLTVFG